MPDTPTPSSRGDSRPVPDPTSLTTAQLYREVLVLRELFEAKLETIGVKFDGIDTRFIERDVRAEQGSADGKAAISAALQAVKEAGAKSETTYTKQIDQISEQLGIRAQGLSDKIDGAKDRLTALEGRSIGQVDQRTSSNAAVMTAIAVIGVLIGVGGLIVALMRIPK